MTISTPLLLGIDGGGTSCRARIVSGDGVVLGEGCAGPANVRLGLDEAFTAILAATREALGAAALDEAVLGELHAGLGLAGVNIASLFRDALAYPLPFTQKALATDIEIARLGAHSGGDGGVVIVGTGSCAEGKSGDRVLRLGGFGFELSDQGSGAAIGRAAMRHSLLVHDNLVPPSTLGRAVLATFNDDPESMVHWAEDARPSDYACFAPVALDHAQSGDAAAIGIIRTAAAAVERLIEGLVADGMTPIALLGGMAEGLRPWLAHEVNAHLIEPQGTGLDGAVRLARPPLGHQPSP